MGDKTNRLREPNGRAISPSDQPVMYATAMLKLRRDYGGDEWVKRFYHAIRRCRPARAKDVDSAQTQILNWLVCASHAAGKDLTPIFVDRWRMPIRDGQRQLMKNADWTDGELNLQRLVANLIAKSE
ncbi:MAG: hypothetical protein AAF483_22715 [Planctomycetota bacterium]